MSSTKIQSFTEDETYNLLNFAGYGQVEADLWLVGFEQFLPDDIGLDGFVELDQMVSKEAACSNLGLDDDSFNRIVLNGNGLLYAELIQRLHGDAFSESDTIQFYLNEFLSEEGSAFFLPFYPIPVNERVTENFEAIFPLFKSYEAYRQKGKKLRVEFTQELAGQFAPKTVIAIVNDEQRTELKEVFSQYQFENHDGIYAGWDTMTIIVMISPENFTRENLPRITEFILENSLPLDMKKEYGPTRLSKAEIERLAKEEAKRAATAKRKNKAKHDPSDPFCVCENCLKY